MPYAQSSSAGQPPRAGGDDAASRTAADETRGAVAHASTSSSAASASCRSATAGWSTSRYDSSDPAFAAEAANALAKAYIEQNLEFKFNASKEAADWLAERLAEQRKAVEASEAALQAFREKNGAVSRRRQRLEHRRRSG